MNRGSPLRRAAESYLTSDDRYETEAFFTPLERHGLRIFGTDSNLEFDKDMSEGQGLAASPADADASREVRRKSFGDVAGTANRSLHGRPTLGPTSIHFQGGQSFKGIKPPPQTPISLHPPRPTAQRSMSNSRIELRSQYQDPTVSSADLQQRLVERTRPLRPLFLQSRQIHNGSAVNTSYRAEPNHDDIDSSYFDTRSNSNEKMQRAFAKPKELKSWSPLKPCIKQKAKSASTTPHSGTRKRYIENKALRRVKTVDFIEGGKPLLSVQPSAMTSTKAIDIAANEPTRAFSLPATSRKVHKTLSFPNIMNVAKSGPASPAVTRTAVHVLAVSSLWGVEDWADEGTIPTPPAMQIVESKNGCFEVIWDDAVKDRGTRSRRRSSSANQASETVHPVAFRGLEKVNTKLTDWRSNRDRSSESFMPTVVVFPDDDNQPTYYDFEVDHDEDFRVPAPPNSQTTSNSSSRLSSRPSSVPFTRRASDEDIAPLLASEELRPYHKRDRAYSAERLLRSDHRSRRLIRASRRQRRLSTPRKLSNIEEADLHFRGHRDSVTIAQSRLIDTTGFSSEPFTHRDSVAMAKKCMHAKNSTTSVAGRQAQISTELLEDEPLLLRTVKERATQNLDSHSLESILCPHQTATQRHIQFVE